MKFLRVALALTLVFAGCSDDSDPGAQRNSTTNNTNNGNNTSDMGDDTSVEDMRVEPDIPKSPANIVVSVDTITFEGVRVGESARSTITISNTGEQDLVVSDVTVGEINRRGDQEINKGSKWIDGIVIIEGGTFEDIEVLYEPTDEETDRGLVTINSTDEDEPVVEVRIETLNPYPDIEGPQLLKFGYVEGGTSSTKQILFYNRGADPLTIQSAVKSGNGPFTLAFLPSEAPPNVIEKDEAFAIDVTYSPTDTNVDRATITVTSDDPNEGTFEIALNGNDPTACITVTPRVADFGELPPGMNSSRELTIFNCSNILGLNVTSIELTDDGGGVFVLDSTPALPLNLSGFGTAMFNVTANIAEGERVGEVTIESNDSLQSPMKIELRAKTP